MKQSVMDIINWGVVYYLCNVPVVQIPFSHGSCKIHYGYSFMSLSDGILLTLRERRPFLQRMPYS